MKDITMTDRFSVHDFFLSLYQWQVGVGANPDPVVVSSVRAMLQAYRLLTRRKRREERCTGLRNLLYARDCMVQLVSDPKSDEVVRLVLAIDSEFTVSGLSYSDIGYRGVYRLETRKGGSGEGA